MLFGWLGDKIGRVRAMSASILTYAIVTGVCGFATDAWQIAAARSRLQNVAMVSPLVSCRASHRRHNASFLRSTPHPMSYVPSRWKESTDRG